jgi:predicted CoA-binding protein
MTDPEMSDTRITEPADYTDAFLRGLLENVKSIAVVGASADPVKASFFVMKYLRDKGYKVIPVNPKLAGQTILGLPVYASLADLKNLPEPPDMVDVFRNSAAAGGVTDEAIAAGAKVVWMQLGVRNDEAAARAQAAGLTVVMDRCPKMEIQRLYGEIGRIGVNSNVLVTRRMAPTKSFKKLI